MSLLVSVTDDSEQRGYKTWSTEKEECTCSKDSSPFPKKRTATSCWEWWKQVIVQCQRVTFSFFVLSFLTGPRRQLGKLPYILYHHNVYYYHHSEIWEQNRAFSLFSICKHAKGIGMTDYNKEQRLGRLVGPRGPKVCSSPTSSLTLLQCARDLTRVPVIPLLWCKY